MSHARKKEKKSYYLNHVLGIIGENINDGFFFLYTQPMIYIDMFLN